MYYDAELGCANPKSWRHRCPYGKVWDGLWVRETHYRWTGCGNPPPGFVRDRCYADNPELPYMHSGACLVTVPSIHMPRAASRIALEVTGVRVERLNDISEADALAEGVTPKWEPGCSGRLMEALGGFSFRPAASAFADLWEQINGPGSWSANPWVWVLAFRCGPNLQPNVGVKAPT
jgi:hypothetical protein